MGFFFFSFPLWWQINLCPWSVNYCPSLRQPSTASLCSLCQLLPRSLLSTASLFLSLFSFFYISVSSCLTFSALCISSFNFFFSSHYHFPWVYLNVSFFSKCSLQLFYHFFFFLPLYVSVFLNSCTGRRWRRSKERQPEKGVDLNSVTFISVRAVSHSRSKAN